MSHTLLTELLKNPRAQARNQHPVAPDGTCVIYWMQRAQRPMDNPALDAAVHAANRLGQPLCVFFSPRAGYPNANLRPYAFLADGVADIIAGIEKKGAVVVYRPSEPSLLRFCAEVRPSLVIVDENPLREPQRWREKAARALSVPLLSVDADAVVPMRLFPKLEYAARTIRPKIERQLDEFLVPSVEPRVHTAWRGPVPRSDDVNKAAFLAGLKVDRSVLPVAGARGGFVEGLRALTEFIETRLENYDEARNKPDVVGTSQLSWFLHFGHLGPRGIANAVRASKANQQAKAVFLEELIVRREVALNFALREPNYDRLEGCPDWARKTLDEQRNTRRPVTYSRLELETGRTGDPLWNAGQREMVMSGRMHGYVRMYWAKKILEWTRSPEDAFALAVDLNDAYFLDGRDPNGYTGIAWAIGGRHDRPWAPLRPIFGMVRYMSLASTGKKFNLKGYVARVNLLESQGGAEHLERAAARGRATS